LEKYACSYLAKLLEGQDGNCIRGEMIDGKEYDCTGWKEEHENKRCPESIDHSV
jgi:hypothetical protein